ncbi:hypothetical protein BH09BAC5_BH09BAC5_16200 [soil metagenome]
MKKLVFYCCVFFFSSFTVQAQEELLPNHFFTVGAGITYSSINSWQENTERGLSPGVQAKVSYQIIPYFNIELATNFYFLHKSVPSFNTIHSTNQELNGIINLPINPRNFFSVSAGISYLNWKGNYSGYGLNGSTPYHPGDIVHYKYFQGDIGLGLTKQIQKRCFIDLREIMRFSSEENSFGLSDISLQLGCRFVLQKPKNNSEVKGNNTANTKKEKGISKGKYKWLKNKRR